MRRALKIAARAIGVLVLIVLTLFLGLISGHKGVLLQI